jgi:hypothetical protein
LIIWLLPVVAAVAVLLIVVPMQALVAVVLEVIVQVLFLLPLPATQSPWVVAEVVALLTLQEVTLEPKAVIRFSPQSPQLVVARVLAVTRAQVRQVDLAQAVVRGQEALLLLEEPETKVDSLQWKVMQVALVITTPRELVAAAGQVPLV